MGEENVITLPALIVAESCGSDEERKNKETINDR
jgi:hypothetical protein